MSADALTDRCRSLAEAYRRACADRGRCEALQTLRPDHVLTRQARFDAGMRQTHAWTDLLDASRELMALAGLPAAAEIREAALRLGTIAGVAAIKTTLARETAA